MEITNPIEVTLTVFTEDKDEIARQLRRQDYVVDYTNEGDDRTKIKAIKLEEHRTLDTEMPSSEHERVEGLSMGGVKW